MRSGPDPDSSASDADAPSVERMTGSVVTPGRSSRSGRFLHQVLSRSTIAKSSVNGRAPSWPQVLSASIAVGVSSGLLELGVLFAQIRGLHYVDWTTLMISRHAGWMVPATAAALIVPLSMLLAAPMLALSAWRLRRHPEVAGTPGPAWGWVGAVLGFLMLLGPLLAVRGLHPIAPLALSLGVGYRIRRLIVRPTRAWRIGIHGAALAGIGILGTLVFTQWHGTSPAASLAVARPAKNAPNLLWIVLDTLRADRMSVYGYERPTTPQLERWARSGIIFETARSTAPWTLPSHISMFTGMWPSEHGARVDRAYHLDRPTIAEHLGSNGYATAGIVANVRMCNTAYGVGRGFAHYVDYPWRDAVNFRMAMTNSALGPVILGFLKRMGLHPPGYYPYDYHQPASVIAAKGREWLESSTAGSDSPFFLFLNFMDVHGPYLPVPGAPLRLFNGPITADVARPEEGWRIVKALEAASPEQRPALQREVDSVAQRLGNLYDECLSGLDAEIGRFLDGLRDDGLLENTWVVIAADHGEHFGEHGHFGHGSTLYNEQTHVPLILIPPMGDGHANDANVHLRGRRIAAPVSLRDLPATMSELLLPGTPSPFPGHNLSRYWRIGPLVAPDPVLSQLDEPQLKGEDFRTDEIHWMESLIAEDHILIEYQRRPTELFDLFGDPKQQRNLADHKDQVARRQRMRKILDGLHQGTNMTTVE